LQPPPKPVKPNPVVVKPPSGPSPLDSLRRDSIPEFEMLTAGNIPGLVAVLGNSRFMHYGVVCLCYSPDGSRVASGCGSTVVIWNPTTGRLEQILKWGHVSDECLCFSPDGKTLAGGSFGTVTVWDMVTYKKTHSLETHLSYVHGLSFSPDSKRIAIANGS